MKKSLFGFVKYTIHENSCLNGLWKKTDLDGKIRNEIAMIINNGDSIVDGLIGEYVSSYIEKNKKIVNGKLNIALNKKSNKFEVLWTVDNMVLFIGEGCKIENNLLVNYWQV